MWKLLFHISLLDIDEYNVKLGLDLDVSAPDNNVKLGLDLDVSAPDNNVKLGLDLDVSAPNNNVKLGLSIVLLQLKYTIVPLSSPVGLFCLWETA